MIKKIMPFDNKNNEIYIFLFVLFITQFCCISGKNRKIGEIPGKARKMRKMIKLQNQQKKQNDTNCCKMALLYIVCTVIYQSTMTPSSVRKVKLAKRDPGLVKNTQTISLSGYVPIAATSYCGNKSR
jgi:hypothetical protein